MAWTTRAPARQHFYYQYHRVMLQRCRRRRTLTTFRQTPRMSTYLVAWVVAPLASKNKMCTMPPPGAPVKLGVWATPDKWVTTALARSRPAPCRRCPVCNFGPGLAGSTMLVV